MVRKHAVAARARLSFATALVAAVALSLVLAGTAAAAPPVGSFQKRASSPKPVNNVVVDPTTNMIYAQQFNGRSFYRYNPHTNKWAKLANSPIPQGNNGGAAYLNGRIYTVYTEDGSVMGVYNIATGKWWTITYAWINKARETSPLPWAFCISPLGLVLSPTTRPPTSGAIWPRPPFGFELWGGLAPYKGEIYGQYGNGDYELWRL